MTPLLLGQILFLSFLVTPLSDLYEKENSHTGYRVIRQIAWDIERLIGMGMELTDIRSMESWLTSRQQYITSHAIAVYDKDGTLHSAASRKGYLSPIAWYEIESQNTPSIRDLRDPRTKEIVGSVQIVMDPQAFGDSFRAVMLDNITLTIVSALFLYELLFLLLMSGNGLKAMTSSAGFMRPIIFGCLYATEISMSYVPIRIGELGLDLFGLPPDVVSGLPVSAELLMAGIAMFIGGFWSQRAGWRPMLLMGILLAFCGALLSYLSTDALSFILARGFSGIGYGFINLSAQVFVIARSSEYNRAQNLAFMFAGLYAGTLCGSAMGGLIADRLGYQAVFPASAVLLFLAVIVLYYILPKEPWKAEVSSQKHLTLKQVLAFFRDKRMGALFLFFIIPNALITVCLFQFFMPLSLSQAGVSPASIGRVFLVYCIIVMFAGPAFGSFIDRAKKMENPLFLSMLIASCSVIVLVFFEGVYGAMLCVALLAVNTAIASNGQGAYALSLPSAELFGRSRTMGFYNVAMRFGQVLGPLSLGMMMAIWDARTGLIVLSIFTLLCAVLFFVISHACRKREKKHA